MVGLNRKNLFILAFGSLVLAGCGGNDDVIADVSGGDTGATCGDSVCNADEECVDDVCTPKGNGDTDLSLVWFTVQTQENRSDYQRTKGKNTGNLPSMDLWLQEDCSRTWTYERPSSAGSRYNS